MGCCGGSCSCGKGNQSPEEENVHLVQMSTHQGMLPTFDWLKNLGSLAVDEELIEVRFKNNRKEFFRNPVGISIAKDDRVVLEVNGGHDLGTVVFSGAMAEKQFLQKKGASSKNDLSKVYRKATQVDTDNWLQAKRRERDLLMDARRIASGIGLEMSIKDVEFQGDGKKVTIYYTADQQVDFRELIGKYASTFRVSIEMKQVGARQEAATTGEQTRDEIPVEQVRLDISRNKKGKKIETGRIVSTKASIKEDQPLFS